MRSRLAVGALLILVIALCAQQTPPPSGPADNMLDPTLAQWEKAMTGLQSFVAEVHRKKLDNVFNSTEVFSGIAKFVKGQRGQTSRASLYLRRTSPAPAPNAPEIFERYVCTGNFLYVFDAPSKIIRYYEVAATKAGQISDDNFLGLLFGMRAEDMKKRYNMRYVPATDPDQAKWYHVIEIQPIQAADKADFSKARLTLNRSNYLPRELVFQSPNGDQVTWDIPVQALKVNVDIPLAEFERPALPAQWKYEKGDQRKVRN